MAMNSREREAEKRAGKLEEIAQQVEDGQLSIRQMTPEERERFGTDERLAREPSPQRGRRKRS